MPPGVLGVTTFAFFGAILALRGFLERWLVCSALPAYIPKRQFFLDYALILTAGLAIITYNYKIYGISWRFGFKFFIGYIASGFFIALDMALARERWMIKKAFKNKKIITSVQKLRSMTRRFFGVAFGTIFVIITVLGLIFARDMAWISQISQTTVSMSQALWIVAREMIFITSVLIIWVANLIFSYSKNLNLLFQNETQVLEQVAQGDLSTLVPVATSDEFGVIAGYTNLMIKELRQRIELISALKMAEEVQRNFLPKFPPDYSGINVAGMSQYSNEVGGDYYDYLDLPGRRLGIVVTDASGHGVGAALHMTTARAFIRAGVRRYLSPARLVNNVNTFLARDSQETGRFTTLFFLEISTENQRLRWVRAGHEPALMYDPKTDEFQELYGEGMALGVIENFKFQEYEHRGWNPGTLVVITTDGIQEARNPSGEMFGKDRLKKVIYSQASESAKNICNAIIDDLQKFQQDFSQEDDVTLVVIKLE